MKQKNGRNKYKLKCYFIILIMSSFQKPKLTKLCQLAQGNRMNYEYSEQPLASQLSPNKRVLKLQVLKISNHLYVKEYILQLLAPCQDYYTTLSPRESFILLILSNQSNKNCYAINQKSNKIKFLCSISKSFQPKFITDILIEAQNNLILLEDSIKFLPKDEGENLKEYFQDVNPYQYFVRINNNFFFKNLKQCKHLRKVHKPQIQSMKMTANHLIFIEKKGQKWTVCVTDFNSFFISQVRQQIYSLNEEIIDMYVDEKGDILTLSILTKSQIMQIKHTSEGTASVDKIDLKDREIRKIIKLKEEIYLFDSHSRIFLLNKCFFHDVSTEIETVVQNYHYIGEQEYNSIQKKIQESIGSLTQNELFKFESSSHSHQQIAESYHLIIKNFDEECIEEFEIGGFRLPINKVYQNSKNLIPNSVEVVQTPEYRKNLELLMSAIKNNRHILIEGGAGSGKTQAITYLASKTKTPLMRINMNKFIAPDDLSRKLKIHQSKFVVENSAFIEAVQKGYWALIDEANLCSYESIHCIEGLLSHKKLSIVNGIMCGQMNSNNGTQTINVHPDFRLFLTQNPSSGQFSNSRTQFSPSFLTQFCKFYFNKLSDSDLQLLVFEKLKQSQMNQQKILKIISREIIDIYKKIRHYEQKQANLTNNYTIREILQIVQMIIARFEGKVVLPFLQFIQICLTQTVNKKQHQDDILKLFTQVSLYQILKDDRFDQLLESRAKKMKMVLADDEKTLIKFLYCNYYSRKPALIYGLQATGKLSAIQMFCLFQGIKKEEIITIRLTEHTTCGDLFGRIYPNFDKTSDDLFVTKEGPITKGIKQGKLIIIQSLNQVEGSVSQSLNGILEVGKRRQLMINDQLVKLSDDTMIIATTSLGSLGSNCGMSPALLSRFISFRHYEYITSSDLLSKLQTIFSKQLGQNILESLKQKLKIKHDQDFQKKKVYRCLNIINRFKCMLQQKKNHSSIEKIISENLQLLLKLGCDEKISIENVNYRKIPVDIGEHIEKCEIIKMTQTRKTLISLIYLLFKMKIMPILQGKPGTGKTKCVQFFSTIEPYLSKKERNNENSTNIISMNENMNPLSMMGQIKIEAGKLVYGRNGALKDSLEKGYILLLDQLNLGPSQAIQIIEDLSIYPKSIINPLNGIQIITSEDFRMIGTQNPPEDVSRKTLASSFLQRTVVIQTSDYTIKQVIQIVSSKFTKLNLTLENQQHISENIVNGYPYQGKNSNNFNHFKDVQAAKKKAINVTLRAFLKLTNRMQKCLKITKKMPANWEKYIQIHAFILYPNLCDNKESINFELTFRKNQWEIIFTSNGQSVDFAGLLPSTFNKQIIERDVACLQRDATFTLVSILLVFYFGQPCMVKGETSFKSKVIALASDIFDFERIKPLMSYYTSQSTNTAGLIGGIEPHIAESYQKYLDKTCLTYLLGDTTKPLVCQQSNTKQRLDHFLKEKLLKANQHNQMVENLSSEGQIFLKCQRNLMLAVRYGGLFYLKYINEGDQSVIEGLNSLLEVEQKFVVDNENIHIHPRFRFICSVVTDKQCSPALMSRMTVIQVKCPQLTGHLSKMIKQRNLNQYQKPLMSLWAQLNTSKFMEIAKKASTRTIRQWLDFTKISIDKDYRLEMLVIGFEMIFLNDCQLKAKFRQQNKNPEFHEIYLKIEQIQEVSKSEQLIYIGADNKSYTKYMSVETKDMLGSVKSANFFYNKYAVKNIFNIICSSYTKNSLNLIGPPGVGKTAICEIVCNLLGIKFVRIACSQNLKIEDLFGGYIQQVIKGKSVFINTEGQITNNMKDKGNVMFLFDEINLLSSDVLSSLMELFNPQVKVVKIKDIEFEKENAIFIGAMNPFSEQEGRSPLPYLLQKLLINVHFPNHTDKELMKIVTHKYCGSENIFKQHFQKIMEFHRAVRNLSFNPNIRNIQNTHSMIISVPISKGNKCIQNYICALACILGYSNTIKLPSELEKIRAKAFRIFEIEENQVFQIEEHMDIFIAHGFTIFQTTLKGKPVEILRIKRMKLRESIQTFKKYLHTKTFVSYLLQIMIAYGSERSVLIQGPSCSSKTSLCLQAARLINSPYLLVPLHKDMEVKDLIGGIAPTHHFKSINPNNSPEMASLDLMLESLIIILNKLNIQLNLNEDVFKTILQKAQQHNLDKKDVTLVCTIISQLAQAMKSSQNCQETIFQFNNGVLTHAIKKGYIIIWDKIEQCKPQVLEKCNSLGEEGGVLFINEIGSSQSQVKRNPSFRIFSTYEPNINYFQPSKATQNRAIKIFVDSKKLTQEIIGAELNSEVSIKKREMMEFISTTQRNIFQNNCVFTLRSIITIKEQFGKSPKLQDDVKLYLSGIKTQEIGGNLRSISLAKEKDNIQAIKIESSEQVILISLKELLDKIKDKQIRPFDYHQIFTEENLHKKLSLNCKSQLYEKYETVKEKIQLQLLIGLKKTKFEAEISDFQLDFTGESSKLICIFEYKNRFINISFSDNAQVTIKFSGNDLENQIPLKLAAFQQILLMLWKKLTDTIGYNNIPYSCTINLMNKSQKNVLMNSITQIKLEDSLSRSALEIRYLSIQIDNLKEILIFRGSYRINHYEKSFESNYTKKEIESQQGVLFVKKSFLVIDKAIEIFGDDFIVFQFCKLKMLSLRFVNSEFSEILLDVDLNFLAHQQQQLQIKDPCLIISSEKSTNKKQYQLKLSIYLTGFKLAQIQQQINITDLRVISSQGGIINLFGQTVQIPQSETKLFDDKIKIQAKLPAYFFATVEKIESNLTITCFSIILKGKQFVKKHAYFNFDYFYLELMQKSTDKSYDMITLIISTDKILRQAFIFQSPEMIGSKCQEQINVSQLIALYSINPVELNLKQLYLPTKFKNLQAILSNPYQKYQQWRFFLSQIKSNSHYCLMNQRPQEIQIRQFSSKGTSFLIPKCKWVKVSHPMINGIQNLQQKTINLNLLKMKMSLFATIQSQDVSGNISVQKGKTSFKCEDKSIALYNLSKCLSVVMDNMIPFDLDLNVIRIQDLYLLNGKIQCTLATDILQFSRHSQLQFKCFDGFILDSLKQSSFVNCQLKISAVIYKISVEFECILQDENKKFEKTLPLIKVQGNYSNADDIMSNIIVNIDKKCLENKCKQFELQILTLNHFQLIIKHENIVDNFSFCGMVKFSINYDKILCNETFIQSKSSLTIKQSFRVFLQGEFLIKGSYNNQRNEIYTFEPEERRISKFIQAFEKQRSFMILDDHFYLVKVSDSIFRPGMRQSLTYNFEKVQFRVSKYIELSKIHLKMNSKSQQPFLSIQQIQMQGNCKIFNYSVQFQSHITQNGGSMISKHKVYKGVKLQSQSQLYNLLHPFIVKLELELQQIQKLDISQDLYTGKIQSEFILVFKTKWNLVPQIIIEGKNEQLQVKMKFSVFQRDFTAKLIGSTFHIDDLTISAGKLFKDTLPIKNGLCNCKYNTCCNSIILEEDTISFIFNSQEIWKVLEQKVFADEIRIKIVLIPFQKTPQFLEKKFRINLYSLSLAKATIILQSKSLFKFKIIELLQIDVNKFCTQITKLNDFFCGQYVPSKIQTNIFDKILKQESGFLTKTYNYFIKSEAQNYLELAIKIKSLNISQFSTIPMKINDCYAILRINIDKKPSLDMIQGSLIDIQDLHIQLPISIHFQVKLEIKKSTLIFTAIKQKQKVPLPVIIRDLLYKRIVFQMQIPINNLKNKSFQLQIIINRQIFFGLTISKLIIYQNLSMEILVTTLSKESWYFSLQNIGSLKIFLRQCKSNARKSLQGVTQNLPVCFQGNLEDKYMIMIERNPTSSEFALQYKEKNAYLLIKKKKKLFELKVQGVKIIPKLFKEILQLCFIQLVQMNFHLIQTKQKYSLTSKLSIQLKENPFLYFFLGKLPQISGQCNISSQGDGVINFPMPSVDFKLLKQIKLNGSFVIQYKNYQLKQQQILFKIGENFQLSIMMQSSQFKLKMIYIGALWGVHFEIQGSASCSINQKLSSQFKLQTNVSIKICSTTVSAQMGVIMKKKKYSLITFIEINYLCFTLQNLHVGTLLSSIFGITNQTVISVLNFLPKINSATFIMGGMNFEEITLLKPFARGYDKKTIEKIKPLCRYADCYITFLGQNIQMKIGVDINSFEFGLTMSAIDIFGIIKISGSKGDDIVVQGEASFNINLQQLKNNPSNFKQIMCDAKIRLEAKVKIKIVILWGLASLSCDLQMSSGYLMAKIQLMLFGIKLSSILRINDNQLWIEAALTNVYSQGEEEKQINQKRRNQADQKGFWASIWDFFKKLLSYFFQVKIGKIGLSLGYNSKTKTLTASVTVKIAIRIFSVMDVNIDFDWSIQIKIGTHLIMEIISRIWDYICGGCEKQSKKMKSACQSKGISSDDFNNYNQQQMKKFLSENNINEIGDEEGNEIKNDVFNQKRQKIVRVEREIKYQQYQDKYNIQYKEDEGKPSDNKGKPQTDPPTGSPKNFGTGSPKDPLGDSSEGSLAGSSQGTLAGTLAGSSQGTLTGSSKGTLAGSSQGTLTGSSKGTLAGSSQGTLTGSSKGTLAGSSQGTLTGSSKGTLAGSSQGTLTGTLAGSSQGTLAGSSQGTLAGTLAGSPQGLQTDASSNIRSNEKNLIKTENIKHNNQSQNLLVQYNHNCSPEKQLNQKERQNHSLIFTCYCGKFSRKNIKGHFSCGEKTDCGHSYICSPRPCSKQISDWNMVCQCGKGMQKITIKCYQRNNLHTFKCNYVCNKEIQSCKHKCSQICLHNCECKKIIRKLCEECSPSHLIYFQCGKRSAKCNGIQRGTERYKKSDNTKSYLKNRYQQQKINFLNEITSISEFDLNLELEMYFKKCQQSLVNLFDPDLNARDHSKMSIVRVIIDLSQPTFDQAQLQNIIYLLYLSLYYPVLVEVIATGSQKIIKPFYLKQCQEYFNFKIFLGIIKCMRQSTFYKQQLRFCQEKDKSKDIDYVILFNEKTRKIDSSLLNSSELRKIYIFGKINIPQALAINIKQNMSQQLKSPLNVFAQIIRSGHRIIKPSQSNRQLNKEFWEKANFLKDLNENENSRAIPFKSAESSNNLSSKPENDYKQRKEPLDEKKKTIKLQKQNIEDGKTIESMVQECRVLLADYATKNQLSTKGVIQLEGILKFFTSGGTCDTIYSEKKGARKQKKPTIIIFDLSLSSRAHLLTCFFPTLYHLSKFLQSKKYPFCIKLVYTDTGIIRSLDHRQLTQHQIHLLAQNIENSVSHGPIGIGLLEHCIEKSFMEQSRESKDIQKSIIVFSNSLHKLNATKIQEIVQNSASISLKVNFLTFNAYPSLPIHNCIELSSFRSLIPIIKLMYLNDREAHEFIPTAQISEVGKLQNIFDKFNSLSLIQFKKISDSMQEVEQEIIENDKSITETYLSTLFDFVEQDINQNKQSNQNNDSEEIKIQLDENLQTQIIQAETGVESIKAVIELLNAGLSIKQIIIIKQLLQAGLSGEHASILIQLLKQGVDTEQALIIVKLLQAGLTIEQISTLAQQET